MSPMVFLAVPCMRLIPTAAVKAITSLRGISMLAWVTERSTVAGKRNFAVEGFLPSPATHLLMVDDDMAPPADLLERLLAVDQPIVGALYAQRTPPPRLMGGWFPAADGAPERRVVPHTGLQRVDWVGAGALLIARPVLEVIGGGPWFAASPGLGGEGEEVHFQRFAATLGFATWCDTDCIVPHLGMVGVTPDNGALLSEAGLL